MPASNDNKEDDLKVFHPAKNLLKKDSQAWQCEFVCHLVSVYYESLALNPEGLANNILETTLLGVGNETIRRFFKIRNGNHPEYAQEEISSGTLEKFASFLSHPNIGLLNIDHLEFRNFPTTAPLSFINSLMFDLDDTLPRLHTSYAGTYKAKSSDGAKSHEFSIWVDLDKDWFVVRMLGFYTDGNNQPRRTVFDGWGTMLPENGLVIHLKSIDSGENTILSTSACPLDFASPRENHESLIMHHINAPVEVLEWNSVAENKYNYNLIDNLYVFQWDNEMFFNQNSVSDMIDDSGEEPVKTQHKWDGLLNDSSPFLKNSRYSDQQKASERAKEKSDEKFMDKKERYLGQRFIDAVQDVSIDNDKLNEILGDGQVLNAQAPFNGFTALHYAICSEDKFTSLWLVGLPDIDLTIQDKKGRTPAALAAIILAREGSACLFDSEFISTLRNKEVEQIRQKMEAGDSELPPAFQSRNLDDI